MAQDNRIRLPPTKIDFETDVGTTGQDHDIYPEPGQPRFDWMRMYLIGLLANQSADSPPTQFRLGTFWVDTSGTGPVLKIWDGVAWVSIANFIQLDEELTLQEWFDLNQETGSLALPIPANGVTIEDNLTLISTTVQGAIDEILALLILPATTTSDGVVRLAVLGDDDNTAGNVVPQTNDPRLETVGPNFLDNAAFQSGSIASALGTLHGVWGIVIGSPSITYSGTMGEPLHDNTQLELAATEIAAQRARIISEVPQSEQPSYVFSCYAEGDGASQLRVRIRSEDGANSPIETLIDQTVTPPSFGSGKSRFEFTFSLTLGPAYTTIPGVAAAQITIELVAVGGDIAVDCTKLEVGTVASVWTPDTSVATPTDLGEVLVAAHNDNTNVGGFTVPQTDDPRLAALPTTANKQMVANATTVDGDLATNTTLAGSPFNGSHIWLTLNGTEYDIGNGTKSGVPFYISGNGGTNARAYSAIIAGDTLHLNGTVAEFQLATTDRINLHYVSS